MSRDLKLYISFLLLLFLAFPSKAQFYNGLSMTFGKNRLQYNKFYWQYYRFERFDVYFSEFGNNLALYTEWFANQEIKRLEIAYDYTIDKRIIFIIFNRLADFRQSNLGLVTGNDESNPGGVTQINRNKVSLYYSGDHKAFQDQISAAISQIILNQMLYGNDLADNVASAALINIPDWFSKGLNSYMSENWSVAIEDKVKNGFLSGKYKHLNRLSGDDAMYAGHSFWRFIEKTYGRALIPNIIYITKVEKNVRTAFMNVAGSTLKDITKEWIAYYDQKYKDYKNKKLTDDLPIVKKPRKTRVYQNIRLSPDGQYLAYVSNELGQYRIWLYNNAKNKSKCIFKREHRLAQITDYSYPVVGWHPNSTILTFFTEEKGGIKLYNYDVTTRELTVRNFLYLEKVLDFSYSPDGSKLIFSGVHNGNTDIYVHTLASSTNEQITNDIADDLQPHFIDNGRQLVFSSNRMSDTLSEDDQGQKILSPFFNIYTTKYPMKKGMLTLISDNSKANHYQPYPLSSNRFVYLGDDNGIVNRYIADFDSTVSYVDTTVHYRYFTKSFPLTNEPSNILEHDINGKLKKLGQIFLRLNRNYLYESALEQIPQTPLPSTEYRQEFIRQYLYNDSLNKLKVSHINKQISTNIPNSGFTDSSKINKTEIDINHYTFEIEKLNAYKDLNGGSIPASMLSDSAASKKIEPLQIRIYQTAFYPNYIVSKVDFSFLNTAYQPFTGGAVYYNPGFNLQFKIGTVDLFEDYKITGGLRFSTDFQSNEYLLSFENLKRRFDRQLVFHRQAYKNTDSNGYSLKTTTQDAYYILKIPFSQVFAFRLTSSLRYDRVSTLSTYGTPANQFEALDMPTRHNIWGGLKGELIFDNTLPMGINIFRGRRFKIFGEAYKQFNLGKSDLFVLGADFRHYQVIHRNLIWANRVAGSSSFGGSRLVYYLGAVDNWINLSGNTPTFDNSIAIDQKAHYAYQTLATNMRGFSQNIRNGNNFMVLNSELRWPFIKYFSNYPISSAFWSSLQVVGFFDAGSAWTGWTPYKGGNAYDKNTIPGNYDPRNNSGTPVVVVLDSNRSPFVFGYGFGARAQILGYFVRFDYAWGVERHTILPPVFYLSLSQDF